MLAAALLIVTMIAQSPRYVEIDFSNYAVDEEDYVFLDLKLIVGNKIYPYTIGTVNAADLSWMARFLDELSDDGKTRYEFVGRKVRIHGLVDGRGQLHPARFVSLRTRGIPFDKVPIVRNPKPTFAIISFSRVPIKLDRDVKLEIEVASMTGDRSVRIASQYRELAKWADLCRQVVAEFAKLGVQADVVADTVQFRGWNEKDQLVPVARIGVFCRELTEKELPAINAWPLEPCVVLDFTRVRKEIAGRSQFKIEIPTPNLEGKFLEEFHLGGRFEVKDVARLLVAKQFKVELDGEVLRVYGYLDHWRKQFPPTDLRVTSRDLKPDELPRAIIPGRPPPKPK